jgi:hypothetical protein
MRRRFRVVPKPPSAAAAPASRGGLSFPATGFFRTAAARPAVARRAGRPAVLADEPGGGRVDGEDSDVGVLSTSDVPWQVLVDRMTAVHAASPDQLVVQ